MSEDKDRKLPAVRTEAERTVLPAPATQSHVSTVASGFGASLRARSLDKHAEEARKRAGYYDAQRQLANSYKEASRAVDELNDLDAILSDDQDERDHRRALAKLRRAEELAQQAHRAASAHHGASAFDEVRGELKDLRKETLKAKERSLAQQWSKSELTAETDAIEAQHDRLDAADNLVKRGNSAPLSPAAAAPQSRAGPIEVDVIQKQIEALRAANPTPELQALIEELQLMLARAMLRKGS